jgi:sugar lactone lactonase YvrE
MDERHTLLSGLVVGESPRWHDGRLRLANWGAKEILAVDVDGHAEVAARVPTTVPFSIDWLPDGRFLVVSGQEAKLLRQESDGSLVTYADLRKFAAGWNEA